MVRYQLARRDRRRRPMRPAGVPFPSKEVAPDGLFRAIGLRLPEPLPSEIIVEVVGNAVDDEVELLAKLADRNSIILVDLAAVKVTMVDWF